jgi:hypothetical protein
MQRDSDACFGSKRDPMRFVPASHDVGNNLIVLQNSAAFLQLGLI